MKINSLAILKATSKLMLAGAVLLLSDGCSDKCKKITCYNGGFCNDGICSCQTGYEGDDCTMEVRAKFLGTYNVNDHCTITGDTSYTVNIAAAADEVLEVEIANFNNDFSNSVRAVVTGNNINIPPQAPDLDGRAVSGNGVFSGSNTITWSYTITFPSGPPNSCSNSVWTK